MLFVTFLKPKAGTQQERMGRRLQSQPPERVGIYLRISEDKDGNQTAKNLCVEMNQ